MKKTAAEYEEKFAKVQSLLSLRNKEVDELTSKNDKLQAELKSKKYKIIKKFTQTGKILKIDFFLQMGYNSN